MIAFDRLSTTKLPIRGLRNFCKSCIVQNFHLAQPPPPRIIVDLEKSLSVRGNMIRRNPRLKIIDGITHINLSKRRGFGRQADQQFLHNVVVLGEYTTRFDRRLITLGRRNRVQYNCQINCPCGKFPESYLSGVIDSRDGARAMHMRLHLIIALSECVWKNRVSNRFDASKDKKLRICRFRGVIPIEYSECFSFCWKKKCYICICTVHGA